MTHSRQIDALSAWRRSLQGILLHWNAATRLGVQLRGWTNCPTSQQDPQDLISLLRTSGSLWNWFKRRSSAVPNSSVRFGTWEERRLERASNDVSNIKSSCSGFFPRILSHAENGIYGVRPRLCGEKLSRAKWPPSYRSYPGRANFSYISLQNFTNRLHEKQNVGSARRVTRLAGLPS